MGDNRKSSPYEHRTETERQADQGGQNMGMILLVILIILLIGAVPTWPYSRNWGYWPSGGLGTILLIVLILFLLGRI
jgi:hypothetical protein